jgi:hypothetical protein
MIAIPWGTSFQFPFSFVTVFPALPPRRLPDHKQRSWSRASRLRIDSIRMDVQSIAQQARAESIKVLVRVRPLSGTELADGNDSVAEIHSGQSLSVTSGDGKKSFRCAYDAVLGPSSSQLEVYDVVKGCTESVIDGFNSTIFAYGQTGSGKVIPFVTSGGVLWRLICSCVWLCRHILCMALQIPPLIAVNLIRPALTATSTRWA